MRDILHTLRMDRNDYRDDNDTDQPDAYWRRRAITLVAGLTLLGLLAWAFSGGGKPASTAPKSAQATGIVPAAAYSGAPTSPSPAVGRSGTTPVGTAASLPVPSVMSSGPGQPGNGKTAGGRSAAHSPASSQAAGAGAGGGVPARRPGASSREGAAHRERWCSACSAAGPTITRGSILVSTSTLTAGASCADRRSAGRPRLAVKDRSPERRRAPGGCPPPRAPA